MAWYDYIDSGTPPVFRPKVTPNPIDAERLEEKFQQAARKLKPSYPQQLSSVASSTEEPQTNQLKNL